MQETKIKELASVSQDIGKNVAYVQGGGGNTSIKIDSKNMAVKASGYLLKDMRIEQGFSLVDYPKIRSYLRKPDHDELAFSKAVRSFASDAYPRPSIETGFHAILGQCVIHTHSVYANLINCSLEGKDELKQLFPEAVWVSYATPGKDLTKKVQDSLASFSEDDDCVVFLENHGLIVSADTPRKAFELHEDLNRRIKKRFSLSDVIYQEVDVDIDYVHAHILFPDQVVYTSAGTDLLNTLAAKETLWAYQYILDTLKDINLTPNFLDASNSEILLNMESEKYRQKKIKS